jgi:outer membrane receptor for monomeric catechols
MEKITKIAVVSVALLATVIGFLMIFYFSSHDGNIVGVENVVSNDKSQETAVVAAKDQNACNNTDWSIVSDTHSRWGNTKMIVCEKNVVLKEKTQGGELTVYKGVLLEEEEKKVYALIEAVIKTSPPEPPKTLSPDSSITDLQIEQGGDIYSYQTSYNEKIPEIQALYDELARIGTERSPKFHTQ